MKATAMDKLRENKVVRTLFAVVLTVGLALPTTLCGNVADAYAATSSNADGSYWVKGYHSNSSSTGVNTSKAGDTIRYHNAAGKVAYCANTNKGGPGNNEYFYYSNYKTYSTDGNSQLMMGLDYIFANGYPNKTTIGGQSFPAGDAQDVTQVAVWTYMEGYSDIKHWNGIRSDVRAAALSLANAARDYVSNGGERVISHLPDVVGEDEEDAIETLEDEGFVVQRIYKLHKDDEGDGESSTEYTGKVLSAKTASSTVYKGSVVYLTIDDFGEDDEDMSPNYSYKHKYADTAAYLWSASNGRIQEMLVANSFGTIEIQKSSSCPNITNGNELYKFEGAVYGIYDKDGNLCQEITLDANGYGKSGMLAGGTDYTVRELKAPEGYYLDETPYPVSLGNGATVRVNTSDVPYSDPVAFVVGKYDGEKEYRGDVGDKNNNFPQGSASLEGAEFTVEYYKTFDYETYDDLKAAKVEPTATWTFKTDKDGYASFDSEYFVKGSAFYYDELNDEAIPRGTIVMYESKAPTGYNKSNAVSFQKIMQGSDVTALEVYETPTVAEDIKRSDIEFQKDADNTGAQLAKVPFLISTKTYDASGNTVYETHVAVTDENGTFQSASSWNKHTYKTNANDTSVTITYKGADYTIGANGRLLDASGNVVADDSWLLDERGNISSDVTVSYDASKVDLEAGIWFGAGESTTVDDSKGAFYYSSEYTVNEVRTDGNASLSLIEGRNFVISRDGKTIDLGTFDDADPMISTTAYDKSDNDKYVTADTVTVVDEIRAEHLAKGNSYTITGEIHDAETGKAITDANGKTISVSKTFTASDSKETVKVEYTFESYDLVGKTLVVYETLKDSHGAVLASEEDNTEVAQQVTVLEPKIGTTSFDAADGDKNVVNEPDATVVDTVKYTNLTPNKEYTVTGTLYKKVYNEDGSVSEKKLEVDGKEVTSTATFTASETGDGETEVTFTFNGTEIADGTEIVVYETAYDGERELVAHADINDESQTTTHTKPDAETTAKDGVDGDKNVIADTEATVVDTVKYTNLTPNKEYTVTGTLYKKVYNEDGSVSEKKLEVDGKEVTSTATFTASETGNGEVDVTFFFDASMIEDETELVAFETISYKDTAIVVHADINDEPQTVTVKTPKIGTTATDSLDGDKVVIADSETSITDNVAYENVLAGQQYTMAGILMDAETGLPILTGDGSEKYPEEDLTGFLSDLAAALGFETGYSVKLDGAKDAIEVTKTDDGYTYEDESGATAVLTQNEDGSWKLTLTSELTDEPVVATLDKDKVEVISTILTDEVPTDVNAASLTEVEEKYADMLGYMVYATAEFTPEKESSSLDMDYLFNSNDVIDRLAGETKDLVVFEVMFKGSIENPTQDSVFSIVATECDKDNEGQTVTLTPTTIGTTATDKSDGDHELMAGKDAVITDEVSYEGLIPGKEYTLKATLMDKQTGEALSVNDKHVTTELKFTPNSQDGTVSIDLGEFDATSLDGHDLVVFEELYKQTTDDEGNTEDVLTAEHKDINDEGQTVSVTKTPNGGYYGKTGIDIAPLAAIIAVLLVLGGGATAYGIKSRKAADGVSEDVPEDGADE